MTPEKPNLLRAERELRQLNSIDACYGEIKTAVRNAQHMTDKYGDQVVLVRHQEAIIHAVDLLIDLVKAKNPHLAQPSPNEGEKSS